MCGIAGFFNRDGKVASEVVLERMLERIKHRGLDDKGTWAYGPVGLGHVRLSILDLSERGHQPFLTADSQGVISYNGEVYNFKELRQELEKEGIRFRSSTDTEVVLYALHQWGPERAIPLFNGMFAFAYYDKRSNILWLARDRMGIKPLYVAKAQNTFAFASEIKALLSHPAIPCRPDMHALTTQMIYGRLTGAWSPFEGVETVVPGTLQKVAAGGVNTITYFDILNDIEPKRIIQRKKEKFEDLTKEFESLFAASVQAHLVSDAPLAAMCSGGLDSSLITAFAKKLKPDIVAYVADVDGIKVSEVDRAEKVCQHLGVELRKIKVDQEKFLRFWPLTVYHNDEPNFFTQNILSMVVSDAVHRDGFKVLLTGEGSDELFGGYDWQVDVYRMWRIRRLQTAILPNIRLFRVLGRFLSKLSPPDLPNLMRNPFQDMEMGWPGQKPTGQFCAVDGGQRSFRQAALFKKLAEVKPLEERAFLTCCLEDLYAHLRTSLSSHEKMAMACSVEARVPFLENHLIDFGLHLPFSAKYHKGVAKRVVKAVAVKTLPFEIVHAPKIGFGINDEFWKDTAPFLRDGFVSEFFKWNQTEIDTILERVSSDRLLLFNLVSMELWARIYCNNESPDELSEMLLRMSYGNRAISLSGASEAI